MTFSTNQEMNNMKEELTLEKKLQALQHHYNSFVDIYETLPPLTSMRKVILDDAISTVGATMNGILNEIADMKFQHEQQKIFIAAEYQRRSEEE